MSISETPKFRRDMYNNYVPDWFASEEGVKHWSQDGLYHPSTNEAWRYNNKIYRKNYVLAGVPQSKPGARALDLGCGAGLFLPSLVQKGYEVIGIDIARGMVANALALCQQEEIPALGLVGNANGLPLPDSAFDLCLAVGLIEHQQQDDLLLDEVARILAVNGIVVVTIRNYLCPYVRWFYAYADMRVMLRNVKNRLLGRPRVLSLSRSREHILPRFESRLRQRGFRVVHRRFSHFYFLPQPLASWFPRLEGRVGKFLEERRRFRPNWLASTITVFAEKTAVGNDSPHA